MDEQLMNGRRTFSLPSDQVLLLDIIKKEFLSIEIWAINDDNPNNNYSHFIANNFKDSIGSFVDKPILGYFSQGDFKAHEGKMTKDPETEVMFWDNGEQILGLIRGKDKVEIKEKDGKQWITTTAVLWTRYNYHQIKKILKDKHKTVSVEINVEDSYFTDLEGNKLNAVELKTDNNKKVLVVKDENEKLVNIPYGKFIEHIKKFDLLGITILGSKMGVPIKPGITGASLSITDEQGNEAFTRQQQALCFAYQQLDNETETDVNTFSKEDEGEMNDQDSNIGMSAQPENVANDTKKLPEMEQNSAARENDSPNLPEMEKNEAELNCGNGNFEGEGQENQCNNQEPVAECQSQENRTTEGCENCDPADDDANDDQDPEDNCKMAASEGDTDGDSKVPEMECGDGDGVGMENNCDNNYCGGEKGFAAEPASANEASTQQYDDSGVGGAEGQTGHSEEDYASLLSKYDELMSNYESSQQALAAQETRVAEMENELEKVRKDCNEYLSVKETLEAKNAELSTAISQLLSEKRYEQAKELMSQQGLTQEQRMTFLKDCQDGKYNDSFDNLKKEIALAYFDFNNQSSSRTTEDFAVNLLKTTTTNSAPKQTVSRSEKLAAYAKGC